MGRRGFTLTELLIIVIILGMLMGIALPRMQRMTERAYRREALDVLLTIYTGERSHFFEQGTYQTLNPGDGKWRLIGMDDPNPLFNSPQASSVTFDVKVTGGAKNQNFTATARRNAQQKITLDEKRTLNDATWPEP